jgi:hypothetical protein
MNCSIPTSSSRFYLLHSIITGSDAHPASCVIGAVAYVSGVKQLGHEVEHLNLPLRFRVIGSIPPFISVTWLITVGGTTDNGY